MEWVRVEERLPDYCVDVLLFTTFGDMGVGAFEPHYETGESCVEWGDAGLQPKSFFTHWMDLPPPPEGK